MNYEMIYSAVRHAITWGGGYALGKGWIDASMLAAIISIAGPAAAILWSLWQKHVQVKAVAVASVSPATPEAITNAYNILKPEEVDRAMSSTEMLAKVNPITGTIV